MKRPSAWSVRRLPSPCERRTDSAEGLICGQRYGDMEPWVNAPPSTPVDNLVDSVWRRAALLWTRWWVAVHNTVGDTPGHFGQTPLTSENG